MAMRKMGGMDAISDRGKCPGSVPMPTRSRGFVLTEVLVVSVIVALLAIAAIPMYSGYITSQKEQAAMAVAQTAAITASSIYRRTGNVPSKPDLNAALAIPNAAKFDIDVVPGPPRQVRVIEQSNPGYTAVVQF